MLQVNKNRSQIEIDKDREDAFSLNSVYDDASDSSKRSETRMESREKTLKVCEKNLMENTLNDIEVS